MKTLPLGRFAPSSYPLKSMARFKGLSLLSFSFAVVPSDRSFGLRLSGSTLSVRFKAQLSRWGPCLREQNMDFRECRPRFARRLASHHLRGAIDEDARLGRGVL
jgi:hypothetical protein